MKIDEVSRYVVHRNLYAIDIICKQQNRTAADLPSLTSFNVEALKLPGRFFASPREEIGATAPN